MLYYNCNNFVTYKVFFGGNLMKYCLTFVAAMLLATTASARDHVQIAGS